MQLLEHLCLTAVNSIAYLNNMKIELDTVDAGECLGASITVFGHIYKPRKD